ncbi:hypothetical protein [Streptomyces sp. NPDC020965]|uniref:hypothetical protein n=1 Tax=Streptomyces sp. NPDC020965 TaxID=3365105 RepID=UPI00378B053D
MTYRLMYRLARTDRDPPARTGVAQRMNRFLNAAAVAAVACAMTVSAAGAAQAAAGQQSTRTGSGEVDRNLLKPPPGGALAPVTDLTKKLLPLG